MRENPVRSGALWVLRRARFLRLDDAALANLAHRLCDMDLPHWEDRYHFHGDPELTLRYLLVLDALNFCFWPSKGRWFVPGPRGEKLSGYFALAYALRRTAEDFPDFFAGSSLASISSDEVREVLGDIPLLSTRVKVVQEVGKLLIKFGSARAFFGAANGRSQQLVELLTSHLPSFRDAAIYQGREVFFHKRAQILCADLFGAFSGQGPGALSDLEWLTAFADYKLPQILRAERVLILHPSLSSSIDRGKLIPAGAPEEVELRAATVVAVDTLTVKLKELGRPLRAFEVDWMLWHLAQQDLPFPHHRTITFFY